MFLFKCRVIILELGLEWNQVQQVQVLIPSGSPKSTIFCYSFGYSVSRMKSPNSGVLTHEGHRKDTALFGSKKRIILKQSPSYIFNSNKNDKIKTVSH